MIKTIDFRSFFIGGSVALLILCALGAAPRLLAPEAVGRFAVALSDAPNGDVYLVDTVTGQIWPKYSSGGRTNAFYAPKLKVGSSTEPNSPEVKTGGSEESVRPKSR
jgi:hypothetical protein